MNDYSKFLPITEEDRKHFRLLLYHEITDEEILLAKASEAESEAWVDELYASYYRYALEHMKEFGFHEPEVIGPVTDEERMNYKGFSDGEIFLLRFIQLDNNEKWQEHQKRFTYPQDEELARAYSQLQRKAFQYRVDDEDELDEIRNLCAFGLALSDTDNETVSEFFNEFFSHLGEGNGDDDVQKDNFEEAEDFK